MTKSVFISSTSLDLKEHRSAVNTVIRRLKLRPIDMGDFGSQPGGASGVSLREVRGANIFIGIIAHRYGYVPDGMTKSVTEQEYDEAVRRGIPRLMYLVDASYDRDWEGKADKQEDDLARERLADFKARINQHEVRSLFTTPDQLAAQVSTDLSKLLDAMSRRNLIVTILAAVFVIVVLIAMVLLADPGIRSDMIAMVISRTPTPTVTSTPTSTFTSTFTLPPSNTLIPTPTLTSTPTTCQTFFQNKDYQNVITACAQQLKITPNDEQIYIYTGIAFRELKQPDLAITAFLKVLEINPESTEVANETSELLTDRCFTNLGRSLQNAFSDCTKAIQLKPDNARAYYWRAEVQREQGECTGAVEDIQRTIEIDPYFEDIIGTAQDQLSFLRVMQQITPEYNDIDVPTCND